MNKQFKEWWDNHDRYTNSYVFSTISWHQFTEDAFPFEYKWGVYLEFFDSKDIRIIIGGQWWNGQWKFYVDGLETHFEKGDNLTRQIAQKEAIKKAFEILNKQK